MTEPTPLDGASCPICKTGTLEPGHTTLTLQRDESTIIVKQVPAYVCDVCGEGYTEAPVTDRVLALADRAVEAGVELDVRRYVADNPEQNVPLEPEP